LIIVIVVVFVVIILEMVVKTRSHNKKRQIAANADAAADAAADAVAVAVANSEGPTHRKRGVKILTPSFRAASIRNYKVYTGGVAKPRKVEVESEDDDEVDAVELEIEEEDAAAEAIMDMYESETPANPVIVKHTCINPMRPITRYMYRIAVYNSDRTLHYKTAYILYNNKNRMYYVYSIISNCYPDSETAQDTDASAARDANSLPEPNNTLQMKYTSYINDIIVNYIMTMIVPSKDYDYSIVDDIIGVVASDDDFANSVFGEDSSYYDVDHLLYDKSSCETTNGFKSFQLIPSRSYWFDPLVSSSPSPSHYSHYTQETINTILPILAHSQ
jgi:hypothetical protein